MQKIISPLAFHSAGPEVNNLQEALLAISRQGKDWNFADLLGEAMFRASFDEEFRRAHYGEATRQAISAFQETYMQTTASGDVHDDTAAPLNPPRPSYKLIPTPPVVYTITGNAYDALQRPLVNSTVRAFDKGMRKETLLGETVTTEDGAYSISFTPEYTKTETD